MGTKRPHRRRARSAAKRIGVPPGAGGYTGTVSKEPVEVHIVDFDAGHVSEQGGHTSPELKDLADGNSVTWVNLDGIHRVEEVRAVCKSFGVHPLWVEDILNPAGRPKAEMLDDRVFVVAKMVHVRERMIEVEQVSIVMGVGWVLTFQERRGDVWEALRQRIRSGNGRIRRMKSDYLLHALLDDVVDHYFLALEELEDRVDELEADAFDPAKPVEMASVFEVKTELGDFRRTVWPMRESISALLRLEGGPIGPAVLPYFRDLYDHVVQVMDILESARERVVGVYELHLAVTGHRLNDIMKVLTIVSTIFIPMTFVAGVYGMNFDYMPELHWEWGYPMVIAMMLASAGIGGGLVYTREWMR